MTRLAALLSVACALGVAPPQPAPLSIVLLIDVTISMSRAMAPFVFDGRGAPDDLNPSGTQPPDSPRDLFLEPVGDVLARHLAPGDRVRVWSIARALRLDSDFSTDPGVLREALESVLDVPKEDRYGPSPLWDAVDQALTVLEAEPGRRAVILITDGLATGNRRSLQAVVDRARRADVSVSVVAEAFRVRSPLGWSVRDATNARWTRMTRPLGGPLDVHVKRLASETGGVFRIDGATGWPDPGPLLASVLGELRQRE